jgi:hypothetical protein
VLDYMGWLRKQPVPTRKHGNPERTLADNVGDVRIFLKEFGVTKLLKKNEEPKYHEKKVVAHTDDELGVCSTAMAILKTFFCSTSLLARWRVTTRDTGAATMT